MMGRGTVHLLPAGVVFAAILACVVALLVVGNEAQAAFPGENGRIAFVRSADAHGAGLVLGDIYAMRPDGSDPRLIVEDRSSNYHPAWSADGTELAFGHEDEAGIYVKDMVSGETRRLTSGRDDREPAWSPDGTKIIFTTFGLCCRYELVVMNSSDGSEKEVLTDESGLFSEGAAAWSPDGTTIAFFRGRAGEHSENGLYLMNPNGTNREQLTSGGGGPDWSPDGTKIAFVDDLDIWVVSANGGTPTRLTDTSAQETGPVWAPDGTKIAYSKRATHRARTGPEKFDWNIWVMNPDGTNKTKLTNTRGLDELHPDWRPVP
jgi:Tol biopolymer transport system component